MSNTSSYWYCLTKRMVATSRICQDILCQDYTCVKIVTFGPLQLLDTWQCHAYPEFHSFRNSQTFPCCLLQLYCLTQIFIAQSCYSSIVTCKPQGILLDFSLCHRTVYFYCELQAIVNIFNQFSLNQKKCF